MNPAQKKFQEIIDLSKQNEASDIHITSGVVPYMRIRNDVLPVGEEPLSPFTVEELALSMMSDHQRDVFAEQNTIDFAFFTDDGTRFRVNVFRQRGTVAMALRRLANEFRSFDDLTLPPQLMRLAEFHNGLVLVTGPTGSGKSTTMATIVNRVNESRHGHIITIEDPVEFVHRNKKCLVRQRELHSDVPTFADAVRAALREDPDVLLVGELRDTETMRAAVTAAETGHLVLSTLHTNDVVGTISRVIGVFPSDEQDSIRNQLARTLRAVVSQRLVHQVGGKGRVPAVEVMFVTSAISNLIRTGDLQQMYSIMQTGGEDGMLLLEQSLASLFAHGMISKDDAMRLTRDVNIFESRLQLIRKAKGAQPA